MVTSMISCSTVRKAHYSQLIMLNKRLVNFFMVMDLPGNEEIAM